MNWFDWTVVGIWILSIFYNIGLLGKPRQPVDGGDIGAIVLVNGLLIVGMVLTR